MIARYAVAASTRKGWKRLGVRSGKIAWFDKGHSRGQLTGVEVERARKWAKRRGRRLRVKALDPYPFLIGDRDCNASLLRKLNAVGEDLGKVIRIRSGRRSLAEQMALYNQNMQSPGVPKPGRPLTAYPNASAPHTRGVAADCGIDGCDIGDYPGASAALRRHGLGLPVAGEDWHVEETSSMVGAKS
jgi:hypothetical protein